MCQFSIAHTTTPEALYARAQKAIGGMGGTVTGSPAAGEFRLSVFGASIVGNYTATDTAINIEITEKPFMVGCGVIQAQLEKALGG
jgi:hypothetical protein